MNKTNQDTQRWEAVQEYFRRYKHSVCDGLAGGDHLRIVTKTDDAWCVSINCGNCGEKVGVTIVGFKSGE
jgi:hypothetical protein